MPSRLATAVIVGGVGVLAIGCASTEEWREWREHATHFASGQHAAFSLRNNRDGSSPRVSTSDVRAAEAEAWWGKAITVSPAQIFQDS